MFKKVKQFILEIYIRLFSTKEGTNKDIKTPKPVKYIQDLKTDLNKLINAYETNEAKLKTDYNNKVYQYEEQYRKLEEAHKKHRVKLISDAELKAVEQSIKPFQDSVYNAGYELQKVQEYKQEDILKVMNEIESYKEAYTEAITEQIKLHADKLQELKEEYLKEVEAIGFNYREVMDTEKTMKNHLKGTSFNYNSNLVDTVELKTKGFPVLLNDLMIDKDIVNKSMAGK